MERVEAFGGIKLTTLDNLGLCVGKEKANQLRQNCFRFHSGEWLRVEIDLRTARLADVLESGVLAVTIQRGEIVMANGAVSLYDVNSILKKAGCAWHCATKTRRVKATADMRAAIAKARERLSERARAREAVRQAQKRQKIEENDTAVTRMMEAVERGVDRHLAASSLPVGTSIFSDLYEERVLQGRSESTFLGISPEKLLEIRLKKLIGSRWSEWMGHHWVV